jgi:tripartite-type tricarboxylate transporter receptor subunit TctC
MKRRSLLASPLLLASSVLPRAARAAGFPERPVRVVVPYAPGTNSDVQTRLATMVMGQRLGQPFIIENRAGAGGSIGAEAVAKSRADGYTLLCGSNGPLAINPALQPRLGYAVTDFTAIGMISRATHTITVRADSPWRTLAEYLAAAKADPGKLSMGTSGTGSATHFTLEMIQAQAGVQLTHVPYRGSSVAVPDLVAGNVASVCSELTTVLPTYRGGQTRILALCGPVRSALVPEVPTTTEAGLAGLHGASWVGLVAPTGLPADVVQVLSGALAAALRDATIISRIQEVGADIASAEERGPAGFNAFITGEAARVRQVAQATGMKLE